MLLDAAIACRTTSALQCAPGTQNVKYNVFACPAFDACRRDNGRRFLLNERARSAVCDVSVRARAHALAVGGLSRPPPAARMVSSAIQLWILRFQWTRRAECGRDSSLSGLGGCSCALFLDHLRDVRPGNSIAAAARIRVLFGALCGADCVSHRIIQ